MAIFEGKTAFVTGATGGIGRAVTALLLSEGAAVFGTGATAAEVDDARGDPSLAGADLQVLDVTDEGAVANAFEARDRLDVLVNLAGVGRGPDEFDPKGFLRTIDINLLGTMRSCYAAYPLLRDGGGVIVNTASMMSFFGSPTAPAYAASRGGVMQFTKSLAVAWAPDGIRTNAVAPGWIDTPQTKPIQEQTKRSAAIVSRTPLGRWGRPDDLAPVIAFLAGPGSKFMTGAIVPVDGGYLVDGIQRDS